MATTNHVQISNILSSDSNMSPSWWWNLTRAMKKAGWKFKGSSNGTTKISTTNPASDPWGAGSTSNAGAAAASITAIANGRATVTGLTGIVATDKGKFLLISGASSAANNNQHQIEEVLSATSVRIDARNFVVVAPDASNGALTWSIKDPLGELYSGFSSFLAGTISWWCAQGPSILRIPITVASVGSFTRGENITQSTTGAQGELIGYHFNSGLNFLVVSPRLRGSGTGVHGWQTGFAITGGTSAATVDQNGTAIDYVYEMVLHKTAASTFQLFIGQFDSVAENVGGGMFSACVAQSGSTATITPGGGGTGNNFSVSAWVMWGNGTTAGLEVVLPGAGTQHHRGHVICADAIPEQGYTADGSWSLLYGIHASNPTALCLFGFHKLTDTVNEDLSPYVSINPGGVKTLYVEQPSTAGTNPSVTSSNTTFVDGTSVYFGGWRRRALGAPDNFAELRATQDLSQSQHTIDLRARVISGPDTGLRIRYPIVVMGAFMIKGTLKWVNWFAYDGRIPAVYQYDPDPAWVQISARVIVGPAAEEPWLQSI